MADLTLSSGREIEFDLYQITRREYASLFDKKTTPEAEANVIAKVAGIATDELLDLPLPDWKRLVVAFYKKAREPLADPS